MGRPLLRLVKITCYTIQIRLLCHVFWDQRLAGEGQIKALICTCFSMWKKEPNLIFPKMSFRTHNTGNWISSQEHCLFFRSTQVLVPGPTWQFITIYNANTRGSSARFCFLWAPGMRMVHRRTYRKITHTNKIIAISIETEGSVLYSTSNNNHVRKFLKLRC